VMAIKPAAPYPKAVDYTVSEHAARQDGDEPVSGPHCFKLQRDI
jgi:hypothetical protein